MNIPSTSSAILSNDRDFGDLVYTELISPINEPLLDRSEANDVYPELLGFIEAQIEFCDQFLIKISAARKRLAEKKALLEKKAEQERLSRSLAKAKVPVIQYLPPYFKDESMMCPPQNEEARHKLQFTTFDPLVKEDKKWTAEELRLLKETVKASLIHAGIQKFVDRKDVLRAKIQRAGIDTTSEEAQGWKDELEAINRKIQHYRNGMMDLLQAEMIDYSSVDWLKISTVDFKGSRSAATLRYKWLNEQCPRWNSGPWTKEELQNLKQYREDSSFSSWAALAKKLQTQRSPYQCFERYRSDLYRRTKEWTKEEDDRLIALVKVMTVNGNVQWDKVTFYMPGRHRQQVRSRYQRTLDENVRHGRWTDHEDLLLMSAVARFGAKDWNKIAKAVYGRSDGQCRERWCNVLDKCTESGDWTPEEDERLALGVRVFGREKWSKIAEILPRHSPESVRNRYQQLLTAKMRICTARLSGRTVNQCMSQASTAIAKAKRDLLRRQLTDDSLKGEFYRAAKEQARRFPGRRTPNSLRREALTPEEKAIVEKGIEEIAQKFRNGEKTPSIGEVLKKIDLSESEITSIVSAAKRRSMCQRTRQIQRIPGINHVKKIAKNAHLLPDTVWERTEFADNVTEEERVMCLTEALCQAVHKYDRHEWGCRFNDNRDSAESAVSAFVSDILNEKCNEVAASLREYRSATSGATLPPTFATAGAYAVFERVRPSLTTKASKYFNPSMVLENEILPCGEIFRRFTPHDRLNIQLHPSLLMDSNYLMLKAQVRCLLFEPTFLAMAIESPEVEEQRIRTQMELTQMEIDEQNHFADSAIMDDAVIGDIEVIADDNEPINYEDSVDDALNDTIDTVMDKVFNPTTVKRRGRPRKDDVLAAYEMWMRKNRRKALPRSAKSKANHLVNLLDGASDSSDDMSMDSVVEVQPAWPESQNGTINREGGDESEVAGTVRMLVNQVSRSRRCRAKKDRGKQQQQKAANQDPSNVSPPDSTSNSERLTVTRASRSNEDLSGKSRLSLPSKKFCTVKNSVINGDQDVQDIVQSMLEKVCAMESITTKRKRGRPRKSESTKLKSNPTKISRAKRPRRS